MVGELRRALTDSWLNVLLVFVPIALVLDWLRVGEVWVFATAAISIVPLAGLIGYATEQLTLRSGPAIGGLLNATFGNGAELLIAGFAVLAGLPSVVKASLSGSILGNLLLVIGAAAFFGGLNRHSQWFSATGASAKTMMLFVAVAGMVMPAVFAVMVLGSLNTNSGTLDELSQLTALVLLIAYVAGLVFSLRTHSDVFGPATGPREEKVASEQTLGEELTDGDEVEAPVMSVGGAAALLAIATILTAAAAEVLVGAVEGASHALGLTDLFIGFIVVAIVGNVAEHYSAVTFARRNQMQLAMNIAKDSSVQIALLVAPLLVLFSAVIGKPMNLVFHPFELFGLVLAVLAVTFASLDGETNWYEGFLLLALYAVIGIATYFVPG